ncbi:patatin-like phospholipase family protein [Alkalicoccus urumqiensis]|uniref:Patatin family protein n=1 Tax=Alkalicoccus urumqiensis TaxID=1548213 RepID=A0A2P6MKR9_ALKUR|nr:patatin family protein [Alkalicoccus urumqiensis]PRO66879.1 patatin family protein [Alkalicoccus urumqiensis]
MGSALILEGGGMRGVFTSGVLEYFLENDIQFPAVYGVSAGACNAASYISMQSGRNRAVTIDYTDHPEYISIRRLLRHGELFNMDLIFDRIPNEEQPFHYERFFASSTKFFIGTTDCETAEPVFYEKQEVQDDLNTILRASSSLPLAAPVVPFQGRYLLDGGLSEPIPFQRALKDGSGPLVIVMTQPEGYSKQPPGRSFWYMRRRLKQFPELVHLMETRWKLYNDAMRSVLQLEQQGRAVVIRPESSRVVSRVERNKTKLETLYAHGFEKAAEKREEIEQLTDLISSK